MTDASGGKISIAMATFNGAPFIEQQLESLANQTRLPDEIVVSDDGSSDGTIEIVERLRDDLSLPIRVLVNDSRLGHTRNFERALAICRGEIVLFCDQDDVWLPDKVERFGDAFQAPGTTGAVCNAEIVDEDLRPLGRTLWESLRFTRRRQRQLAGPRSFASLLSLNPGYGITVGIRQSVARRMIPAPEIFGHDVWALIAAAASGRIAVIDEAAVLYRQHGHQQVPLRRAQQSRAGMVSDTRASGRERARLQLLTERLPDLADAKALPRLRAEIQAQLDHLDRRDHLPDRRLSRVRPVLVELLGGEYSRRAKGWRTAARDLLRSPAGETPAATAPHDGTR